MEPARVRVMRGELVESLHRAHVVVSDAQGGLVAYAGDPDFVTFLRSSAKPLQAISFVETGAMDRYGLDARALAVAAGSHNGEELHTAAAQRILDAAQLKPTDLRCGAHAPYSKSAADRIGTQFTALHNNCSGKHAGFLATCAHNGWDLPTYLEPHHPLQALIRRNVAEESGVPDARVGVAVDGCGAPTFSLSLRSAARAFARLSAAETVPGERGQTLRRIRDAMMAHPDLVAGEDRVDTRLMRAFAGEVWVKAGAEACYAMGLKSRGLGIVIKVEDGTSRAIPLLLIRTLEALIDIPDMARATLAEMANEPIRNVAGRAVGRLECELTLAKPARALPAASA